MALDEFFQISDQLRYKKAALWQLGKWRQLAQQFFCEPSSAGSHMSKWIWLPVGKISVKGVTFLMRDNFHDINLWVNSPVEIDLPFEELFEGMIEPCSWDWYLEQITCSRNYSWRGWSDEDMDDPRILIGPNKEVKSPAQKTRWMARLTNPEWYAKDWSSADLFWDGTFGPGVKLWRQERCYLEGINHQHIAYEPGKKAFSICCGAYMQVALLIHRISECQP